jgi:hypothetical protein
MARIAAFCAASLKDPTMSVAQRNNLNRCLYKSATHAR